MADNTTSNVATGAAAGTAAAPGIGTLVGGGLGLLGSLLLNGNSGTNPNLQAGIDAIKALQIPDTAKALLIQQYTQSGSLSPALVAQLPLNADQKTLLTENPQNRANQQTTLNALQQLSQNGMSAQDLAQAAASRSATAQDENAANASLQQQAQQRGQGSSGNTLAAQLSTIQGGAQNASKDALNQAASAANARQQALTNFGNQATAVRGQDYNTQAFNTQNDILRQQFLDQNAIGRQNANVAATNQANQLNLQRQQAVSDANTKAANDELARQQQAKQQMFYDAYLKASGLLGAGEKMQDYQNTQNAASTANLGKIITGGATLLGQGIDYANNSSGTPSPSPAAPTDQATSSGAVIPPKAAGATEAPPNPYKTAPTMDYTNAPMQGPANTYDAPASYNAKSQLPPGMTADMLEKKRAMGTSQPAFWHGGIVTGQPTVPGDSPANDTKTIKASPGEMVIPRTKMKNPVDAKDFVDKHFNGKSNSSGFTDPNKHTAILDLIATLHSKKLRGNTGIS